MTAEDSKRKILEAAASEFADRGLAGVRMEHVAARAGVNKALVYRYFKTKEELANEVLRSKFTAKYGVAERVPDDLGEAMVYWFHHASRDVPFLRLQLAEVLNGGDGTLVHEAIRRTYFEQQVAAMEERRARGQLPSEIPAPEILLALIALVSFPAYVPTMARLVTGLAPDSPAFKKRWDEMLTKLARRLTETGARSIAPATEAPPKRRRSSREVERTSARRSRKP